jgi:rRNA maturation endonuclease Nob1
MEKRDFSLVEEGGIQTFIELENDIVKLILSNPKLACPSCGKVVTLNGKCKTCPDCGWSSCDA